MGGYLLLLVVKVLAPVIEGGNVMMLLDLTPSRKSVHNSGDPVGIYHKDVSEISQCRSVRLV